MRDLLNSLSTLEVVLLFVGGAVVVSVGAVLLVEKHAPGLRQSSYEEGALAVGASFTLLFGLILALTITDLSSNSDAADASVSQEATALAQITRTSEQFPVAERARLRKAVEQYVHAVAGDEFETMRHGRPSGLAAFALRNLYNVAGQSGYYSEISEEVDELTSYRRERLQIAGANMSTLFRTMLSVGAVLFVVLAYPAKLEALRTRLLVVAGTAAFTAFVYVLTIVLDLPFSGELATTNQPYKEAALATYWPGI